MPGSTPRLKKADNGIWYIHWTEKRVGKRVSTRTKDLADAKAFLGTWLLMDHEAPTGVLGENLTLADVWLAYERKHVDRKIVGAYGAKLAWKQMQPFFGHLPASGLSQMAVDEYIEKRTNGRLGRKVKPQTVTKELSYLRAAVKFCASDKVRLIDSSYARKLELPEQGDPRDRWLKTAETQKLLDAAAKMRQGGRLSRGERFLWLALETAARKQALLDLTWDRVDFETNVIDLEVPGRKRARNKRRAVVPISKALRPVLDRAYKEREGDLVLDNKGEIWPTIQSIAMRAGLAPMQKIGSGQKPKATGISPHVLRHTAATHMARRGVPLWIIAKILGNSLAVVEKVYAKHAPDDLRAAVELISNSELEPAE